MNKENIYYFEEKKQVQEFVENNWKKGDAILFKASNGMKFFDIVSNLEKAQEEDNLNKIKLGVVFGGMSTENEVSCISGASVIKHLNKEKYNVFPIYIDKIGNWYKVKLEDIEKSEELENKDHIENITEYLKQMDVIFPVLHGLYGEDGTIQGLFELLKIPYVGCGVLASSVGMDKVYTKLIFEKAHINQAKYIYIRKYNEKYIYIDEEFNERILELEDIC